MSSLIVKKGLTGAPRLLTIIVGVKAAKKAVDRNKIKRRIRAIMRARVSGDRPLIVIANPEARHAAFQTLKLDLEQQLQRLKIFSSSFVNRR